MKLRKAIFLPLCCAVIASAGCSVLGRRQNDSAALSMQNAAAEVQYESRSLELTMGALRDLVSDPAPDLRRQYKHYNQCLAQLENAAHKTESTGKNMEATNTVYLQTWDKHLATITYDHVREISQTRRAEVGTRFDAVKQRYEETQAVVGPMISYLRDIRNALNSDLTMEGLTSVKGVVQNAEQNAAKVQTALTALSTELANSGTRLASIGLQANAQANAQAAPR